MKPRQRIKSPHYAWMILACCCVIMGATYGIEGGVTGSFIEPVSRAFHVPVTVTSSYITVKGITTVLTLPLAGRLLRGKSGEAALAFASLGYGICLMAMAASGSIFWFFTAAVALGICGAFLTSITVPLLIGNWFHRNCGLALGIAMASSGFCGSVFGPIISNIIRQQGFRRGYMVMAFIVLLVMLPMVKFFVRIRPGDGVAAYGEAAGCGERTKKDDMIGVRDGRSGNCMLSNSFICVILFGVCLALANGMLFHLTMFVSSRGFSAASGAMATSLALAGATLWKLVYGYSDKFWKVRRVVLCGAAVGVLGLVLVLKADTLPLIYGGAFLYGSIVSLMTLEPPLLVKEIFGPYQSDQVFVYVSMAVQLSYALAPLLYAGLFDWSGSYRISAYLCAVIGAGAVIFGYLAGAVNQRPPFDL